MKGDRVRKRRRRRRVGGLKEWAGSKSMASTSAQAPREGETPRRSARGRMPSQASINQQLSAFKSISAQAPLVPDQWETKWNTCTDKFKRKPWLECELITASNLQRSWMIATLTGHSGLQAQKQLHDFKTPKILNKCVLVCKHYQRFGLRRQSCQYRELSHFTFSQNSTPKKKNKYEDLLGYKVLTIYTCLNHKSLPHCLLKTQVFVYALVNPVKSETLSL